MKSELERLFSELPQLDWHQGEIYKSKKHTKPLFDEEQSNAIIADYFNGSEITVPGEDNNPENETFKEVNGYVYIEYHFQGSYKDAFLSAINSLKK